MYAELYEEARWDFITKNGFGLDVIQKEQKGPVILEMNISFRREIKLREQIKIVSQTKELMNSKILILEQKMVNAAGKVASEAKFTVGFFDMKQRKLVDAGSDWLKAVGIDLTK